MRLLTALPVSLAFASTVYAQRGVVELSDAPHPVLIGEHFEVLADSTGEMSFDEVRNAVGFVPMEASVPNLGVSESVFWLRTKMVNHGTDSHYQIQFSQPEIEDLGVGQVGADGKINWQLAGQTVAVEKFPYDDYDAVFPLVLAPGSTCDLYVRVSGTKQIQLPMFTGTPTALSAYRSDRNMIVGIYFGVMLVLLFYNLFVFFSTRDRSFFIYVLYISLVALTQAVFLGIARYYLWPGSVWFSIHATSILTVITALVAVGFMRSFIQTRQLTPGLDRGIRWLCLLLVSALIVRVFIAPRLGYQLMQPLTGALPLYQLLMAIVATRRGSRSARFFLVAWTIFLLGIVVFILKDLDVLPYNALTQYTMPLGSAVEGILLSFGLADKINILRREKERSQAEALQMSMENERIIREQNVVLEHKVKERTHELQESNEHLKRTQTQLVNAEKMAGLGQLTAGIAHEINNPVNFISSNIPPLRRNIVEMMEVLQQYRSIGGKIEADEVKAIVQRERELGIDDSIAETGEILNSIENGASRTAEIVRGLRNFSRLDEGDLKTADINEGVRSTLAVLSPQVRDLVRIELDLGQLPVVECYPGKLNQVFMNVLTNAAQAVKTRYPQGGGTVSVSTRTIGEHVVISVRDNGAGFTPEIKGRMFEPFFTTKGVGEGTGLGLSIAYGIMEKHHGTIEGESLPEGGAEFRIVLPINQTSNARRA